MLCFTQGRWGEDVLIAKRRNAIDQMLLQLATGLRSTEANMIDWSHVKVDDEGVMSIEVTKRIAKGGDPRVALVLMPQVAERLLRRKAHAKGKGRVIGAPADPARCGRPAPGTRQRPSSTSRWPATWTST